MTPHDWRRTGALDVKPGHDTAFEVECEACKHKRFTFAAGEFNSRAFFSADYPCTPVVAGAYLL